MTRIKGRRSGGPQTAAGKAKSSRNAFRHGLSVSILKEPAMCAEVEKLARLLAGQYCDDFHLSQARIIAEAQLDLARIQDAKVRLSNAQIAATMPPAVRHPQAGHTAPDMANNDDECDTIPSDQKEIVPNIKLLKQLAGLDRYKIRPIERRRRAMRAFFSRNDEESAI